MMKHYQICIDEGTPFSCRDDMTVMRTMGEKRIGPKHHGCCGGGCGVCKMQIVAGEYEVVSKMSRAHISFEEQAVGIVLLCCVQPRSNLTIKSISF